MKRKQFLVATAAGVTGLLGGLPAWAQVKLADANFPGDATVAGQKLLLNGAGVRFRFGLKIYAAALYVPAKVSKNDDVIKAPVKRMQLIAMRDIKSDDFGKLFSRAMEDNAPKEEFSKLVPGVLRLGAIFSEAKQFARGDVINLDYLPGTGTVINFRGKSQGEPIKEPEFNQLLMKIWFGSKPVDESLRKALLGEQSTANTNIN
jgi:hypothetical protein